MSAGAFEAQAVQGVYEHAASLVKEGKTKMQVREDLKSRGLDDASASVVTDGIFELRTKVLKESAQLNILYGALLFVGGIVVTAVTDQIASSASADEHYIIAWGTIAFGAIQFVRGLAQKAGIG
jgi:hypothetical protein